MTAILLGALALSACELTTSLDGLSGGGEGGTPPGVEAGSETSTDASRDGASDARPGDSGGSDAPRDGTAVDGPLPDTGVPETGGDGPVSPYAYRRPLSIMNVATDALPAGFTVRVALDPAWITMAQAAGKLRNDLGDLRVFQEPQGTELDRIVDTAAPSQGPAVWLALASPIAAGATDTSYYLYYDDPNAGAPPANGANVFAFYDDFPGSSLSPQWLVSGAPTVSNGVTLHMNTQDGLTTAAGSDNVPVTSAVESVWTVTDPQSQGQNVPPDTFWYWFGYQRQGDFVAGPPWYLWIARQQGTVHGEESTAAGPCTNTCTGPEVMETNTPHWYRVERWAGQTIYYFDGTASFTTPDTNTVDYSIMIRNWALTSDMIVTLVRARALASQDPMVTVGAEEAAP